MKACSHCGVALTPGLGGDPQRIMVMWPSTAATTADLCRGCYEPAVRAILEAILEPPAKTTPTYKRVA